MTGAGTQTICCSVNIELDYASIWPVCNMRRDGITNRRDDRIKISEKIRRTKRTTSVNVY